MPILFARPSWWTWRASGHARIASLATLWLLLLAGPFLGPFAVPLFALRMVVSTAQLWWNTGLGRTSPLESRTRGDWILFGITFLLAMVASEVGKVVGDPRSPLLLSMVALPYSGIQVRTLGRSYRAAERNERLREAIILRLEPARRAA